MRCNLAMSILLLSGPMDWTDEHDKSLMKEVRVQNPFQAKKKTTARAKMWQSIAEALSGLKDPPFKEFLTKRSVQDRYSLVSEKYRMRMRKEAMASGISPPYTELDQLIEECIELEKLGDDLRQKDGKMCQMLCTILCLLISQHYAITVHQARAPLKKVPHDTGYSLVVTHPSTHPARPGLTLNDGWRI